MKIENCKLKILIMVFSFVIFIFSFYFIRAALPVPEGAPLPENFEEIKKAQEAERKFSGKTACTSCSQSTKYKKSITEKNQNSQVSEQKNIFSFDHSFFKSINSLAGKNLFVDALMIFIAKYLIFWLGAGIVFFEFFPKLKKNFSSIIDRQCLSTTDKQHLLMQSKSFQLVQSNHLLILLAFFSSFLAFLLNLIISLFRFRLRPFITHSETYQLVGHVSDKSFPSDHTAVAFALGFSLFLINKKWGIIFLILAFLIGFARIFCGLHYPLDVLGGILIALFAVLIIKWVFKYVKQ